MKKIHLFSFLLVFCAGLALLPKNVFADVPPGPGHHFVDGCTRIVNQDQFPEIVVISVAQGAMYDGTKGSIVIKDACLSSYKFSRINLFGISKEKINSIDLEKLAVVRETDSEGYMTEDENGRPVRSSWDRPRDLNLLTRKISHYAGYVPDSNPALKIDTEYSLAKKKDGSFILYKSKEITEFNNGKPAKIKTFNSPVHTETEKNPQSIDISPSEMTQPKVVPLQRPGFWRRFACMLGLFKTC